MARSDTFPIYRSDRSPNLVFGLVTSILLHIILFLGADYWLTAKAPEEKQSQIPIEYVEVPSNQTSTQHSATYRRAARNSVAGGQAKLKRPVSATNSPSPVAAKASASSQKNLPTPTAQAFQSELKQPTAVALNPSPQKPQPKLQQSADTPDTTPPAPKPPKTALAPTFTQAAPKPPQTATTPTTPPAPKPLKTAVAPAFTPPAPEPPQTASTPTTPPLPEPPQTASTPTTPLLPEPPQTASTPTTPLLPKLLQTEVTPDTTPPVFKPPKIAVTPTTTPPVFKPPKIAVTPTTTPPVFKPPKIAVTPTTPPPVFKPPKIAVTPTTPPPVPLTSQQIKRRLTAKSNSQPLETSATPRTQSQIEQSFKSGAASRLGGPVSLPNRNFNSNFLAAKPNSNRFNQASDGIDAREDEEVGLYQEQLGQKVKPQWKPEYTESPRRVVLHFTISRAGLLSDLRVVQSSGFRDTDENALNAVKRSAPFAPLPTTYKDKYLLIEYTFNIYPDGEVDLGGGG